MHQIRYFLALSETLNFTRAAEQCNVSQPSMTRAIRALELELGGDLIRRERSLSHLTELGHRVAPLLRNSYEGAVAAKALAQSFKKGGTIPLALAISQTVKVDSFVPIFQKLALAFPGLQMDLKRGGHAEVAEMLKSGGAELAIAGRMSAEWERFDSFPLFVDPYQLFACREHQFSGRNRIDVKSLEGERLLIYPDEETGGALVGWLRNSGIENLVTHKVATDADLTSLLEANLGVAIVPESAVQSQRISSLHLDGLQVERTVAAYCVAGRRRSQAGTTALNLLRCLDWSPQGVSLQVSGAA